MPLVFWWSDRSLGGLRLRTPVGLVDVAPTIAELAGLPALPATDGRSLAASVTTGGEPEAGAIVGHRLAMVWVPPSLRGEMHSLRLGRWKLLRVAGSHDALYDLATDPDEGYDVHALRPQETERLERLLDARLAVRRDDRELPGLAPEDREGLGALGYAE